MVEFIISIKSDFYYTHGITPKRVKGDGVHLRDLTPGQHENVAKAASRWQLCVGFDQPGIEPTTPRADSDVLNHHTNRPLR